jgi:hypothetical protein
MLPSEPVWLSRYTDEAAGWMTVESYLDFQHWQQTSIVFQTTRASLLFNLYRWLFSPWGQSDPEREGNRLTPSSAEAKNE